MSFSPKGDTGLLFGSLHATGKWLSFYKHPVSTCLEVNFFKRLSPETKLQKNNEVRLLFGCPRSAGTQKAEMDGLSTWLPLIPL